MQLSLQKGSRSVVLGGLLLITMALIVARLFYLQIIKHDEYVELAAQEQIKPLTIPAKRGQIYMMDGGTPVKVVLNQPVYTLFADPQIIDKPEKVLEVIRRVAGGNLQPDLEYLLSRKNTRYQILGRELTRKQAEMIKKENLRGIGFQEVSERVYPEGSLAAQTLGFVNADGKGQYGIEEWLNDRLVGHDGLLKSVTDISGVPLTIGDKNTEIPAKDGDDIALTIDRNIQSYVEKTLRAKLKEFGATHGSVIVMDPQSGKVMAMANYPTYNPQEYNKVKNPEVFNNAVINTPYEPGSDIKTFTMATGIDTGTITPKSTYVNKDYIKVQDRTIVNATKGETGTITMQHALNWSLNTGVVTIAQRLGDGEKINRKARDTMYDYFHNKFRFGHLTGIELSGEQPGIIISPTEVEGNAVRYSNMTFGQGMDLTMIQVATAFCALVNGGTYYQPSVIAGTVNGDGTLKPSPQRKVYKEIIKPSSSKTIHAMIRKARSTFYSHVDKPGYDIGGKTGTSQTIVNGRYIDDQTIATYLGYGGDNKPRYVIMVETSGKGQNLQGNLHALPIFTDISNWLIDYLKLQPNKKG